MCHVDSPLMRFNRRMLLDLGGGVRHRPGAHLRFVVRAGTDVKSNCLQVLIAAVLIAALPRFAAASGHGPVFGAATPTLGKGGWQIDQAWLGRLVDGRGTATRRCGR